MAACIAAKWRERQPAAPCRNLPVRIAVVKISAAKISAIRIMTGELAPARHVPCAATRGSEPRPDLPHDASPVARHIQVDPTLAIPTSGRTKCEYLKVMIVLCLQPAS
jgi:hypothetical protein